MFTTLGNSIPTDFARRYLFDGSGNSTTGTNNATVTNGTWIKSERMYQAQCLSWGATTSCTYASVTYTNSYIWIYSSGVWTFTKNSSKVTATDLNGVNGERYAGLTFFNRTLTSDEEQLLELEGRKLLGPTSVAKYPKLFEGLVYYADFKGTAHNLIDGNLPTTNTATLTTDMFGNSNGAYNFDGSTKYMQYGITSFVNNQDITVHIPVKVTSNPSGQSVILNAATDNQSLCKLYYVTIAGVQYIRLSTTDDGAYTASHTVNLSGTGWRWITITKISTGVNQQIYLDGVPVGTAGSSGTALQTLFTLGMYIGKNNYDNTQLFNGDIGSPIVFNRGLSADEVKLLYIITSQDYIYPSPSYDLPNLRDGLVLDLNEQGKDLSGNGNDGTLVNSPVVIRQGRAKGLSYNSSNQAVNLGTNKFPTLVNNCTFTAWIRNNSNSTIQSIFSNGNNGTGGDIGWYFGIKLDGVNNTYNFTKPGIINENTGVTPSVGRDDFICLTITSNIGRLYINSVLVWTGVNSTAISNNTQTSKIGCHTINSSNTQFYNGRISNPRLLNRVLSDKEIQALYYSQKANFVY